LKQRTHARAHALVGWLSGRLDLSVRPCGRARGGCGSGSSLSHSPGPVAINYRRYHILYRDLPSLCPTTKRLTASDPALVDVVRGMRDMVMEARAISHPDSGRYVL
jgi:hypothetical protein